MQIVDLFAGPGGWSEGLKHLGLHDIGIEWDEMACRTRAAAGHISIRTDVHDYPPERFLGYDGLIASPPCTAFSTAGAKEGRKHIKTLISQILTQDWTPIPDVEPTVWLPLEVGRWVEGMRPRWIACEQVPPAYVLWEAYEPWLRSLGYSTWSGVLNAADYGVPQTRQRAFLLASLDHMVGPPEPTHCKGGRSTIFGEIKPWTTMAEALGWGLRRRAAYTILGVADAYGGEPTRRAMREAVEDAAQWVDRSGAKVRDSFGEPAQDYEGRTESRWKDADEVPSPTVTGATGGWAVEFPDDGTPIMLDRHFTTSDDPDQVKDPLVNITERPAPTVHGGSSAWEILQPDETIMVDRQAETAPLLDAAEEPAPTFYPGARWKLRPGKQANAAERSMDEPAPTVAFGHDANSWEIQVGFPRKDDTGTSEDGYRERDWKSADEPSNSVTEKARSWEWRRNDQTGTDEVDRDWPAERPATTLAGRDLVPDPGTNANRFNGAEKSRNDGYKISVQDAAILQSFPHDYPWQGTRTKQFQQVGNAVPPRLAAHVISAAAGVSPPAF